MCDRGQKRAWGSRQRLGQGWLKKHALIMTSQIVGCEASGKARGTVRSEWHSVLRGHVGQNFKGFDRGTGDERDEVWGRAFGAVNEEAWMLRGVLWNGDVFWKVVERWEVGSKTVRD